MSEAERNDILATAKDQPHHRSKLADKATRTGQAYLPGNQPEADKWFALAGEIRGLDAGKINKESSPPHYEKVEKKLDDIKFSVEAGAGIRKMSRDTGVPLGRPPTGKQFNCPDCGKEIYIRKYRLDHNSADKVYRCRECANKRFLPPNRGKRNNPPDVLRDEFLKAGDKVWVATGLTIRQLEEKLRRIEYLEGYRQAVLDVSTTKGENQ